MADRRVCNKVARTLAGLALLAGLAATAARAQQRPPTPPQGPPQAAPQQRPAARPPAPAAEQAAPAQAAPVVPVAERVRGRRDPFRSLLVRAEEIAGAQALPPGKRGLVIGQIRIDGIVRTPADRIAVVSVPNRNRAYFLREQDELFNGYVAEIHEEGVIFKERTTDAFGRPYEREVIKQVTSAAGATR